MRPGPPQPPEKKLVVIHKQGTEKSKKHFAVKTGKNRGNQETDRGPRGRAARAHV